MIKLVFSFFLLFTSVLQAQVHIPVFPGLEGDQLKEQVLTEFKPNNVLSYGEARDTMFGIIDNYNDSLTCVYSGHTIYLNPNEDPTQAAFMSGASNGINTEHTYPQSLGAELGNARSDMHHLFPTRSVVNSARGSKPFEEIDDINTEVWYYLNTSQVVIPSLDIIDLFSETDSDGFEPPENHKGDVARAMFYFYTMYQDFADGANPNYFNNQSEILCQWHFDDPVDEKEYNRTLNIAKYQDGKVNPFIYDCSLAARLYCPLESCEITAVNDITKSSINVYPNPVNEILTVELNETPNNALVSIINMHGITVKYGEIATGNSSMRFDLVNLESGIYLIRVTFEDARSSSKIIIIN